ncbi:MAG: hypothetical protein LBR39_06785 [Coriobacteriales bacterium]|nr:hypothetical protein [Coriobacteriales bacterium]
MDFATYRFVSRLVALVIAIVLVGVGCAIDGYRKRVKPVRPVGDFLQVRASAVDAAFCLAPALLGLAGWVYLFVIDELVIGASVVFGLLMAVGVWGVIYTRNWRLDVYYGMLIYTPGFGQSRSVNIEELTAVRPTHKNRGLDIFTARGKLARVGATAVGYDELCAYLRSRGLMD